MLELLIRVMREQDEKLLHLVVMILDMPSQEQLFHSSKEPLLQMQYQELHSMFS